MGPKEPIPHVPFPNLHLEMLLIHLNEDIHSQFPVEEAAYLTLHFQYSIERLQKYSGQNKRVIVVCPMGIEASVLLRTKLEEISFVSYYQYDFIKKSPSVCRPKTGFHHINRTDL
jgi:activator of the mannose operon (transcriptional antiterminator)